MSRVSRLLKGLIFIWELLLRQFLWSRQLLMRLLLLFSHLLLKAPRAPASSRPLYQLSSASFTCLQSSSSHEDLSLLSFRVAPVGLSRVKVRVKVVAACVCLLLMALLTCCSLSARSSLSWLTSCFQLSADLFSPL